MLRRASFKSELRVPSVFSNVLASSGATTTISLLTKNGLVAVKLCSQCSYVMGGGSERGAGPRRDGLGDASDSDDDEGRPLIRDHFFRDPQLVEINQKIEELTKRNNFLEGTASGLQDLLNASKKREKDHLQQVCALAAMGMATGVFATTPADLLAHVLHRT